MTDLELAKELQERLGLNPKAEWMQKRIINKTKELELLIIAYGLHEKVANISKILGEHSRIDYMFKIDSEIIHSEAERDFVLLYLEHDIFIDKKLELIEKREKISKARIIPRPAPAPKTGGFMKNIY